MKIKLSLLALIISFSCLGQETGNTIVYGKVTALPDTCNLFEYSGIMYTKHEPDGAVVMSSISVDSNGYYKKAFLNNTKIELSTYFKGYYHKHVTIYTDLTDSIRVDFVITPKVFYYTNIQAAKDTSLAKEIKLITFDTLLYNYNKRLKYTQKYGYDYIYKPKPSDYDFESAMYNYNWVISEYLNNKNGLAWQEEIAIIEDSLTHLEADNYGKQNNIDLNNLVLDRNTKLPEKLANRISKQKKELNRIFRRNKEEVINYSKKFILDKIDTDSNYHFIFSAEYWLAYNYYEMIPELIKRITINKEIGLVNTADLIINERIQSGDLQFYGHGGVAFDDLFKISGRANHLLKRITGEDFGSVSMYSTPYRLKQIQNRWVYWLLKINKSPRKK